MDEQALERAKQRIAAAREGRNEEGRFEAALRRSREEVEALGAAALTLEAALPDRVGEAVQEGLRREVLPVARNLAEIKGLLNNAIGRLERLEQELIAERNARLDDLTLLVDLDLVGLAGRRPAARAARAGRLGRDRLDPRVTAQPPPSPATRRNRRERPGSARPRPSSRPSEDRCARPPPTLQP